MARPTKEGQRVYTTEVIARVQALRRRYLKRSRYYGRRREGLDKRI